ncbi:MAG: tetratricopeptide repeat protein, partial [Planctomycetota bacterium]
VDHLAGLFLRVAEVVPIIVHFERAEHLDGLSREFLETMARVIRTRREGRRSGLPLAAPPRLAVILTTENDERCPVALPEGELLPIHMRGLDRDEFTEFVEREYNTELALSLREKLYQATKGNPLDLAFRMRREREDNPDGSPESRIRRCISFARYETEVMKAVRRLDPERRRLLHVLAVAGKPVSEPLLAKVAHLSVPHDHEDFQGWLADLESDGWLRRLYRGGVILDHLRTQEPILDTLTKVERRNLHCTFADAVRDEYPEDRPNRRLKELYFHQRQGDDGPRLVDAGFRAADESLRLYDFEGASEIYRDLMVTLNDAMAPRVESGIRAMVSVLTESSEVDRKLIDAMEKLLDRRASDFDSEVQASLWRRIGELAGHWDLRDREMDYYQRAFEAVKHEERSQERMKVYACLAQCCLERLEFDETLRYCREGIRTSELDDLTDDPEFLELCRVTEEIHYRRGDFVEARKFEEQSLRLARAGACPMAIVESLLRLGHLCEAEHDYDGAAAHLDEARPIAASTGSRVLEARVDERLGYLHSRQSDWEAAHDAFSRALEIQSELGDQRRNSSLLGALGMVCFFMGKAGEGAHNFRLFALYQKVTPREGLPPTVPALPCDYRSRSERDDSIRARQSALSRATKPAETIRATAQLSDLLRDRGELDLARATIRKALRVSYDEPLELPRIHLRLGLACRWAGEIGGSLESFQRGLDAMPSGGDREILAEFNVQVGLLQLARGELRRAQASLLRGLRTYLEVGHETGVTHALIQIGEVFLRFGEVEVAEQLGVAALAMSDMLELDRLEAEAWLLLGRIRSRGKVHGAGHQEVATAREIFNKLGILEGRCRALVIEGEIFVKASDFERARAQCAEALEIARDLGLRPLMARCLAVRGLVEGDKGGNLQDLPRAVQTLEAALEHAKALGDRLLAIDIHAAFARLYHQRGKEGVVKTHLRKAQQILQAVAKAAPSRARASLVQNHPAAELLRAYDLTETDAVT